MQPFILCAMQNSFRAMMFLFAIWGGLSLAQLPDYKPEPPSASHQYYVNQGQLRNSAGDPVPEVKYYTAKASPAVYLADNQVSLVYHGIDPIFWTEPEASRTDTSYRLDMRFICQKLAAAQAEEGREGAKCGRLMASEPGPGFLNYFLPHCGPSGITGVDGYQRVKYENAFAGIDAHLYSNAMGLKMYFEIQPGANPDDILLEFTGQDSLEALINGQVEMYLAQDKVIFPQATAYQIINGNPTPLSWLPAWHRVADNRLKVITQGYDSNHPLVIRVGWPLTASGTPNPRDLCWSTHYGGDSWERFWVTETHQGLSYHLGSSFSQNFPLSPGVVPLQGGIAGGADAVLVSFTSSIQPRWTTYIGGSGNDYGQALDFDSQGRVVVALETRSSGLPTSPGTPGYSGVNRDVWWARLEEVGNSIFPDFARYFGGSGGEAVWDLVVTNSPLDHVVLVGETSSPDLPIASLPSSYNQAPSVMTEAFICEFNQNNQMVWSTYLGGSGGNTTNPKGDGHDGFHHIQNYRDGELLVVGYTNSANFQVSSGATGGCPAPTNGDFPICTQPSAYNQVPSDDIEESDLVIAQFDQQRRLQWLTAFGGNGDDSSFPGKMVVDPNHPDHFYLGATTRQTESPFSFPFQTPSGAFSFTATSSPLLPLNTGLIAEFTNRQLTWSTLFGCPDELTSVERIVLDGFGNLYLTGYTSCNTYQTTCGPSLSGTDFPICQAPLSWQQVDPSGNPLFKGGGADGYLAMFDPSRNLAWSTWYGSEGFDDLRGLGYDPVEDRLYFSGKAATQNAPLIPLKDFDPASNQDYFQPVPGSLLDGDAVVAAICLNRSTTGLAQPAPRVEAPFEVYPNPTQGEVTIQPQQAGPYAVTLFDATGRRLKHWADSPGQLSLAELPAGSYFLRFEQQGTVTHVSLIKP